MLSVPIAAVYNNVGSVPCMCVPTGGCLSLKAWSCTKLFIHVTAEIDLNCMRVNSKALAAISVFIFCQVFFLLQFRALTGRQMNCHHIHNLIDYILTDKKTQIRNKKRLLRTVNCRPYKIFRATALEILEEACFQQ